MLVFIRCQVYMRQLYRFVSLCTKKKKKGKSVVWFVVKLLRIGISTRGIFCSVVLVFSVQLLSVRNDCYFQISVLPFTLGHTLSSGSGTLQLLCHWTWRGTAGTATLTCLGVHSRQSLGLPPQLQVAGASGAAAASQQWSSTEALTCLYFALRRSCVLCARDTREPRLCSLC